MRVLLGHNYYRSTAPSGEDAVFKNEISLLKKHSIEVIPFERFNDNIDDSTLKRKLAIALNGAWSKNTYDDVSSLIRKIRPDVAHFHNTFPLISSSAYVACAENGVPVVQTLHNYRFICPGALLTRNGIPCEKCIGTNLFPALLHRCYRGSLFASGAQVWTITSNRWKGIYHTKVNRYIALTHFAAGKFAAAGLPSERIVVKPNFLSESPGVGVGGGGYALYAGRLSHEKGIHTLIEAWKSIRGLTLKVLGEGPLGESLRSQVLRDGSEVEFLGFLQQNELMRICASAEFMIIPSECYEGFPMAVLEAYACGTPVLASRIGSLNEIVIEEQTGLKFEPGNVTDLVEKITRLCEDAELRSSMRVAARAAFDNNYSAEENFARIMAIYSEAINDFQNSGRAHEIAKR